jgi:hypothetical protein
MNKTVDHWIAVADTLKRQRDMAEQERDEWKRKYLDEAGAHDKTRRAWGEEVADMTRRGMRDGSEFGSLLSERDALRAECEAMRKDAARLDWMADDPVFEGFVHIPLDVYEFENIVAEQHGRINPNENDRREAFRRMIDAATEATQ